MASTHRVRACVGCADYLRRFRGGASASTCRCRNATNGAVSGFMASRLLRTSSEHLDAPVDRAILSGALGNPVNTGVFVALESS